MTSLRKLLQSLRRQERGQGMVEYSLILALVSVVAAGTLTTMGTSVKAVFTNATSILGAAH
ncbi:MAG: Flp/Fap pilin component [Cyanobacteria bacterium RYN_339]|nr:Flp/Fap pilin component [Cyanobacteria bacterium RYN_339]